MNIISKALDTIKMTIPLEVLRVVFKDDIQNWRQAPVGLDNLIMEKVIKSRVLVDANLVGGTQVLVSLDGIAPTYTDNYSTVYEIPPDRTNYLEIISVLSVSYMAYGTNLGANRPVSGASMAQNSNDMMSAGRRLMNSHSSVPVVSSAMCNIVGANTVLIRDQQRVAAAYVLRCILGNDENLNNISPRSYGAFATLCQLAVKSYIYNTMIVRMDQAFLSGGQELGAFKNYVEGLADSEEMYQTHLRETWASTAFMNDVTSFDRFIRLQISPGI